MSQTSETHDSVKPHLSVWDAVSIIVGIVVGTSIFKVPPLVFSFARGPWLGLGCWLFAGFLVLIGSLVYAELGTTYPRVGGDYVYLTRAFGRGTGFLFGWAQLAAILTGSIGAMAYAFGDYAVKLFDIPETRVVWFAVAAVIGLTFVNLVGLVFGRMAQNILSAVKVLGLVVLVIAGLCSGCHGDWAVKGPIQGPGIGVAMVLVLYAYGGWNDAAFVAAEVRNRNRNIPLALIFGTAGIALIYMLVNLAYLWALGFEGVRASNAPAADVLQKTVGAWGAKSMSLLVMLSALGAVNGLLLTGSRICVGLGRDHRIFERLGRWDERRGVPVWSILAFCVVSLLLILVVGTASVQHAMDSALKLLGLPPVTWEQYGGGFAALVSGTAPVFWIFFLLTGISMALLRIKDRGIERPFSAPLYPLEPIVFGATCIYMLYQSLVWAKSLSLLGLIPLAIGYPLYLLSNRMGSKPAD